MALVKCPHCNGVVSDKAVNCPHCGCSLGKPTIIQHGNSINSIPFAMVGKSLLAFIILAGGAMCILPLFTNLYCKDAPVFGYYLPVTYVLVSYGMLAGLLSVGLAINGIIRLCKHKKSTWEFWLLALAFACVSAYGVFRLANYNDEAYYKLCDEKVEAIKGTYECQLQDGNILRFSIIYADTATCDVGGCELKSSNGIPKVGSCDVSYFPQSNLYNIYCYEIGMNYEYLYANAEMTILRMGSHEFPLKKISDKAMTKEEYKAEAEAEEEAIKAKAESDAWKTESKKWIGTFSNISAIIEGDEDVCPITITLRSSDVNRLEGTYEVEEHWSPAYEVESKKWTINGYIEDGEFYVFTATNGKHKSFDITNTEDCHANWVYHYHYSECADFRGAMSIKNGVLYLEGGQNFEGYCYEGELKLKKR